MMETNISLQTLQLFIFIASSIILLISFAFVIILVKLHNKYRTEKIINEGLQDLIDKDSKIDGLQTQRINHLLTENKTLTKKFNDICQSN
jgi:hypothetical protein